MIQVTYIGQGEIYGYAPVSPEIRCCTVHLQHRTPLRTTSGFCQLKEIPMFSHAGVGGDKMGMCENAGEK